MLDTSWTQRTGDSPGVNQVKKLLNPNACVGNLTGYDAFLMGVTLN